MTFNLKSHDTDKMETRSSSEGSLASSAADDIEGKSSEVLLEELAGDYSRFLNFNVSKEVALLLHLSIVCGHVQLCWVLILCSIIDNHEGYMPMSYSAY